MTLSHSATVSGMDILINCHYSVPLSLPQPVFALPWTTRVLLMENRCRQVLATMPAAPLFKKEAALLHVKTAFRAFNCQKVVMLTPKHLQIPVPGH